MLLAFLTFAITVGYVPGLTSAAHVGRWAVMALAVLLLVFRLPPSLPISLRLGAAFIIWCSAGLLWSISPWDTLGGLGHLIPLAAVCYLAMIEEKLEWSWLAFALGANVSAVFAIAQHLACVQPVWSAQVYFMGRFGQCATTGLMLSVNSLAELSAIAIVAAIGLRRYWLIPGPLLACLFSHSREAVLMLAASTIAWSWPNRPLRWALLFFGFTVVVISILINPARIGSLLERREIWVETLKSMSILGAGLNTYAIYFPDYEWAHNEYLQVAFETGFIGTALFALFVAWAYFASSRLEHAILAGLGAAACVWTLRESPATAMAASLALGGLVGALHRELSGQPLCGVPRGGRLSIFEAVDPREVRSAEILSFDLSSRQKHSQQS